MSRYSLRIKTAQKTDVPKFVSMNEFTTHYPPINLKRELFNLYTVTLSDIASADQFEKFCEDFGITQANFGAITFTSAATPFSRFITIGDESGKRLSLGQFLRPEVAEKYFGITDKYVKVERIKNLSLPLKRVLGFSESSERKARFVIPYTGENEELKKMYDSARGKITGLSNQQWFDLLEKPALIEKWKNAGNDPNEFKNPRQNSYFSSRIFKGSAFDAKLATLGFSDEQISSMSMQDKINHLQSVINRQLEEYFVFGRTLPDVKLEKIKYVGNDPESLPEEIRLFGATDGQWAELIQNKYRKDSNLGVKLRSEEFRSLSSIEKSKVVSSMWDNGELPTKTKPKFAYTGNDPVSIQKLKENGLYGRPIDADDIKATDYISFANFRQRLSREGWAEKIKQYQEAILSNRPNVEQLKAQLQEIWNQVLTYSSNKSQMDKILDDNLKPLNEIFREQGITFQDEQNVYAQYKAGETIKNLQLRFDYLVRKNGKIVLAIENQGDQHYIPLLKYKNKDPEVSLQIWLAEKLRDKVKLDYCHDHNIPLLYISGYLTTVEYKKIAENLAKNINYYVNLIPGEQQTEQPGENRQNQYIVRESNDLKTELQKYADRLVTSHFSELQQPIYANLDPSRMQSMIHDKKIILSNLLGIFASNFGVNGYNNLDYIKSLNETTDLSQYYRYIDAACARFGYADSQLGRMVEQISFGDRQNKKKYKLPDMSTIPPQPIEQNVEPKPVQEMSLKRHKKKKYNIKRLY